MSRSRNILNKAIEQGEEERGSVEFKQQLSEDIHLRESKRKSLVAQLRHRVISSQEPATYVIGVTDDGDIEGLSPDNLSETLDVLSVLAEEANAHIQDVQTWPVQDTDDETKHLVALAKIADGVTDRAESNHIVIGTAGHVDHGKSTLIGSLVTGNPDDGDGGTRSYMDVKPHEIKRGLSADLSYAVYGFDDGEPIRMDNPTRKQERSDIVEDANKLVSFVDTVGHKPWLRTTIRGLVGQRLDYGLLTVSADDGPTDTTREHLGILLATELPTIVAITKTDLVDEEKVEEVETEVENLLREVGCTPLPVSRHGTETAVNEISDQVIPIVRTSAVTMSGMSVLDQMFKTLPKTGSESDDEPFEMYIDRTYNVEGVGAVVSGTIRNGTLQKGDELLIGPFSNGEFKQTKARSIEIHYHRVEEATSGQLVSIALKNMSVDEIQRGMVLLPRNSNPNPVREFEANVMVLNHPTMISDGYEPVVHLETISEVASIHPENNKLLPGDKGKAVFKFKFQPHYIQEGQQFVFREGKSKGIGTVTNVETES